jgi:cytochrome c-type biogenesis protein CcmH
MILGIVLTLMTAAAVLCVLWPLARARSVLPASQSGEAAVYRDQLSEIERDQARGLIGTSEASAARTEIARRLIAASEAPPAPEASGHAATRRRRVAALLALVALPVAATIAYGALGRPDLPDLPLAARQEAAPEQAGILDLVARVEAEIARNPQDGRGWDVLAPVYMRLSRLDDAAKAYAEAIRLLGTSASREAGLGEALTIANQGQVTPDAKAAFQRAVQLEPDTANARFYLAQAAEQEGDGQAAANLYRELLADAAPDAPWRDTVKRALASAALGSDGQMPVVDPQTLAGQSPEDRLATIRGMVEGLENRLKDAPADLPGQLRLIRAWSMLGDAGRARAALAVARGVFADEATALRRINDLALGLDLEGNPA